MSERTLGEKTSQSEVVLVSQRAHFGRTWSAEVVGVTVNR